MEMREYMRTLDHARVHGSMSGCSYKACCYVCFYEQIRAMLRAPRDALIGDGASCMSNAMAPARLCGAYSKTLLREVCLSSPYLPLAVLL
jgi:hypothetical protein